MPRASSAVPAPRRPRRLKLRRSLSLTRAPRLADLLALDDAGFELEAAGVLAPSEGAARPRDVLVGVQDLDRDRAAPEHLPIRQKPGRGARPEVELRLQPPANDLRANGKSPLKWTEKFLC